MPINKATRSTQASPVRHQAVPVQPFLFPKSHHLVIATQKHVLQWDGLGVHEAFASESDGIVIAKEAKDGSGVLAIADSQVVLLHDPSRRKERTYTLNGTDGQIRLLEFSNDSAVLFFTTTLQNLIQSYSLKESRLLDPVHQHPSPPTVLAISSTSHLLLSASENPPTIFLQNLTLKTNPLLLQPRASAAAVTVASFHPDRANIFLLGFKDGTIAAYDATRFLRDSSKADVKTQPNWVSRGGEISHFNGLHMVTNRERAGDNSKTTGSRSVGITGAAFVPGNKTKAVTVGGDGKCRMVDFSLGGKILRTWHVKGPATSLSILPIKTAAVVAEKKTPKRPTARTQSSSEDSLNGTATRNIIAIGRLDGKVLLYDEVGLLLQEQTVDTTAGCVIDVDWIHDPTPRPIRKAASRTSILEDYVEGGDIVPKKRRKSAFGKRKSNVRMSNVGISARDIVEVAIASVVEQFEEDFEEMGTVNFNPMEGPVHRDLPLIGKSNYMDLFSPVKQQQPPMVSSPFTPRKSARSRPRPRIRSSTFVDASDSTQNSPSKSPLKISGTQVITVEDEPLQLPEEPLMNDTTDTPKAFNNQTDAMSTSSPKPDQTNKHVDMDIPSSYRASRASLLSSASANTSASANSQVLANLRRFANTGKLSGTSNLALFAPYINSRKSSSRRTSARMSMNKETPSSRVDSGTALEPSVGFNDDIWLTSDDEEGGSMMGTRTRHGRISRHVRKVSVDHLEEDDDRLDDTITNDSPPFLVESTGAKAHESHASGACECGSRCCASLRSELADLREEMYKMREEMAEFITLQQQQRQQ